MKEELNDFHNVRTYTLLHVCNIINDYVYPRDKKKEYKKSIYIYRGMASEICVSASCVVELPALDHMVWHCVQHIDYFFYEQNHVDHRLCNKQHV